ncbi:uncharacterized protein LOC130683963 [Manis pentadactyla]|uniref:uncharacterized protein LOC130683963 n=1 Tax=Manis pentadactyla TaxID=143292 RepID=UPI00255C3156|nr:uncharacterized protein LOC130683963 [Manis pentadactyla]
MARRTLSEEVHEGDPSATAVPLPRQLGGRSGSRAAQPGSAESAPPPPGAHVCREKKEGKNLQNGSNFLPSFSGSSSPGPPPQPRAQTWKRRPEDATGGERSDTAARVGPRAQPGTRPTLVPDFLPVALATAQRLTHEGPPAARIPAAAPPRRTPAAGGIGAGPRTALVTGCARPPGALFLLLPSPHVLRHPSRSFQLPSPWHRNSSAADRPLPRGRFQTQLPYPTLPKNRSCRKTPGCCKLKRPGHSVPHSALLALVRAMTGKILYVYLLHCSSCLLENQTAQCFQIVTEWGPKSHTGFFQVISSWKNWEGQKTELKQY